MSGDPLAELARAEALADLGRYDEAAAVCDRELARDARSAAALNLKGFCLARQGRVSEALPLFKLARLYLPISAAIRYNLGKALEDAGDEPAALEEYSEALKLEAGHVGARVSRGSLRMRRQELSGALEDLDEALRLVPEDADALVLRGACRIMAGRRDEGRGDLAKAVELDPGQKDRAERIAADLAG